MQPFGRAQSSPQPRTTVTPHMFITSVETTASVDFSMMWRLSSEVENVLDQVSLNPWHVMASHLLPKSVRVEHERCWQHLFRRQCPQIGDDCV